MKVFSMKRRPMTGLLCICMLTACGVDSAEPVNNEAARTPAQKIAKMQDSGGLPELERTDTVKGIDADKNGIRDDIDAYIQKTYPSEEQQKAVSQYARSLQASLSVDKADKIAVKAITNEKARAISCIFEKIPNGKSPNGDRVVKEILSMTTNTRQRLFEYIALDKALDGAVISLPSGHVCDE
ncbi:hypothetical protein [Acinetobacter sp.]|uniref:hypothetical protein n=1 Tax=Acinetobacter sp. TaxID=472 RepID=UPI0035B22F9D